MSFYYFVASLPALTLSAAPPWTFSQFLGEARRLLEPRVVREIEAVVEGRWDEARSELAARWRSAETQLRNALARARAARLETDPAPHLRPHEGFSVYVEQAVIEAYAKPNPLERELSLDRFRWSLLDEWAREEPFGLSTVLAYALKLKLSERWGCYSDEDGRKRFDDATAAVRAARASR
ncbi:MAG: DUF2764 domain-containing protein [Kiritimatiellae bacterium]|nr:DUF2764 domain-containing protein [Kiritimatiellia bacterium]MDW8457922.1 DUF2764 family protein [Verrucomicrobiota bacterium]